MAKKYELFVFVPKMIGEDYYRAEITPHGEAAFGYALFETMAELNAFAKDLGAEVCKIKSSTSHQKKRKPSPSA